jgi:two-component system, chemotaxis family, protein-glutamate methylesterase/glutaminase
MMPFQMIAVGTSLGGFEALKTVLGGLPADFPATVVVVQHRSGEDSDGMLRLMEPHVKLPIVEVEDKDQILPGYVYLSPPNYHLVAERDYFALSADSPVLHARPSIDVLFESVAESFGQHAIGVLLTGMSRDGTAGLARIKERGGFVVVQDPTSAEGQMMPRSAIASVAVDKVLPLAEIAPFLVELCAGQRSNAW